MRPAAPFKTLKPPTEFITKNLLLRISTSNQEKKTVLARGGFVNLIHFAFEKRVVR